MHYSRFLFLPLLLASCAGNAPSNSEVVDQAFDIVSSLTDECFAESFKMPSSYSFHEIRRYKNEDGTFHTKKVAITFDLEKQYLSHSFSQNGIEGESYYFVKDGALYECEAMNGNKFYSTAPDAPGAFASLLDIEIAKEAYRAAVLGAFTDFRDALNLIKNTTPEKLDSFEAQGMIARFQSTCIVKGNRSIEASNELILKQNDDTAISRYTGAIENGLPITSHFDSEVSGERRNGNVFDATYKNVNIRYPNLSGWTKI